MRISRTHHYAMDLFERYRRGRLEERARRELKKHDALWRDLSKYLDHTISSGASYADYWLLYSYIRNKRPKEVLECGTGVTTIILAHAMKDNDVSGAGGGRITSMENVPECYRSATELMPKHLKAYVDINLSEKVEDAYSFFRGVRYKEIPDRPYDFVFIDGPGISAPSDGHGTFDFDFIRVLERSRGPLSALVDTRLGTCFVLAHILRQGCITYDYKHDVGLVGPCTKEDLLLTKGIVRGFGPHPLPRGSASRFVGGPVTTVR